MAECLPRAKAQAMSVEERKRLVARKRKKDPNPDRRGKAIMSSSKTAKDAETLGSMSKESNSKRNNVRERLAKLMDAYKNSNRY